MLPSSHLFSEFSQAGNRWQLLELDSCSLKIKNAYSDLFYKYTFYNNAGKFLQWINILRTNRNQITWLPNTSCISEEIGPSIFQGSSKERVEMSTVPCWLFLLIIQRWKLGPDTVIDMERVWNGFCKVQMADTKLYNFKLCPEHHQIIFKIACIFLLLWTSHISVYCFTFILSVSIARIYSTLLLNRWENVWIKSKSNKLQNSNMYDS